MLNVVHVKSQLEIDEVYKILERNLYREMFRDYGECIIYFGNNSGFDRFSSYVSTKHKLYSFEEFLILKGITIKTNKQSMEKQMLEVLNKTYDNLHLRRTTVPLFMSNPGIGKLNCI